MTETELKGRLRTFAIDIIRLCGELPDNAAGRVLAHQLIRSGTSPGTNYRAACRGRSRAEFISKWAIADEEMDESNYWLDLIMASRLLPAPRVTPLLNESDELTRILASSRLTATLNAPKNQKSKIKNQKSI